MGQKPTPRIVTAFDLPDLHAIFSVRDIAIDEKDYVIFAGQTGVFRSNGQKIRQVRPENIGELSNFRGFFHGAVYDLWLNCFNGDISYIKHDTLFKFPLEDSLSKLPKEGIYESIYQDASETVHIAPRGHGYYTVEKNGETDFILDQSAEIHGFVMKQLSDGKWFHFSLSQGAEHDENMSLYLLDENNQLHLISELDRKNPKHKSYLISTSDGSCFFSFGTKTLLHIKDGKVLNRQEFSDEIVGLFMDSKDILWIGNRTRGLTKVENGDFSNTTSYWSANSAVACEDKNGGIWFRSDSSKYGYIKYPNIPRYAEQGGYPEIQRGRKIILTKDRILMSNVYGELYFLENDSLTPLIPPGISNREGNFVSDFCYDQDRDIIWVVYYGAIQGWNGQEWTILNLNDSIFPDKNIVSIDFRYGRVIGNTKDVAFEITNNGIEVLFEYPERINGIVVDEDQGLWCGATDGLWKCVNGKLIRPFEELPELLLGEMNLKEMNGVIFMQKDYNNDTYVLFQNKISILKDENGPICPHGMASDTDGNMWYLDLACSELAKLSIESGKVKRERFRHDESSHTTFQNLVIFEDALWASSDNGLYKMPLSELNSKIESPATVVSVLRINQQAVILRNEYALPYDQNNISIEYDAVSFRGRYVDFSYRMSGIDSTWITTGHNMIQYTNLEPGKHVFEIRSRTFRGIWSEPRQISFIISPPFWQTWWFITLVILSGLLVFSLIVKLRIRQVRKKENEKSQIALEIAQLEMKALKAQINPHFIFNSITSAMFYLSQNKTEEAESYLQRFSRLIRSVLESSDQQFVSLKSEVELMRNYVTLESEQYIGEPISFEVFYNNLNPEEIKIPPTLIQPYIENAIRHGLKTKVGARSIALSFVEKETQLEVRITDNGIGRDAARKLDYREGHKSYGMLISSRRIEVLNRHKSSRVKVNDLHDTHGIAVGTEIYFVIPLTNEGAGTLNAG